MTVLLRDTPKNVRYARLAEHPRGGILFDYAGHTIRIAENERTVCLVGWPRAPEIIAQMYGGVLQYLDPGDSQFIDIIEGGGSV